MKKILIIGLLILSACAKNGKDGAPGATGPQGLQGPAGINGTNNEIAGSFVCEGAIPSGNLLNTNVYYGLTYYSNDDVFVSLSVYNLDQYNISGSAMYAHQQTGATNGYVAVYLDNNSALKAYINENGKLILEFIGTGAQIYTDVITCTTQSFN